MSEDRILIDFVAEYLQDQEAGHSFSISHYLSRFPGHEEAIARQYLILRDESAKSPTTPPDLPPEEVIGRYRLEGLLGHGGQGVVYRALDPQVGRAVALKVLRSATPDDDELVRFRREAELAARIDHPGICTIFEVGRDHGRWFIAMRLVEGETLAHVLEQRPGAPGPDELRRRVHILERTCRAVDAAHERGIIHRDLKPANVMVQPDEQVVVLDFGLARRRDDLHGLTATGAIFGTPAYMAPEQLLGEGADRRSDIYALGVMAHRLLTGVLPFDGPTPEALRTRVLAAVPPEPRRHNPLIDRDLQAIITTALAREPVHRYVSAKALADDLVAWLEQRSIAARPAGSLLRIRRWARRQPATAAALLITFLALAGGLIAAVVVLDREHRLRTNLLQASDVRRARLLLDEETGLYPVEPPLIPRAEDWLRRTRAFVARRPLHEAALREIQGSAASSAGPDSTERDQDAWHAAVLQDILGLFDRLTPRIAAVDARLAAARSITARSGMEPGGAWSRCLDALPTSPHYSHLSLRPQMGLLPLRADPTTGLWDFLVVESGAAPQWDEATKRWAMLDDSGIILVLLPGGDFVMGGFESDTEQAPNDVPPHPLHVEPFFISRYEMTQGQWARLTEGEIPSYYKMGRTMGVADGNPLITGTYPVEQIDWQRARMVLGRAGLVLPSEAQWEYAARGGTTTTFWSGDELSSLEGCGNLLTLDMPEALRQATPLPWFDRYAVNAPVGQFRPNPYGLFDTMGNVFEMCEDAAGTAAGDAAGGANPGRVEPPRVNRGGSSVKAAATARSSYRNFSPATAASRELGVRPARPVRDPPSADSKPTLVPK